MKARTAGIGPMTSTLEPMLSPATGGAGQTDAPSRP
jgi:hypothetical protein